jgi:hypothetical protein
LIPIALAVGFGIVNGALCVGAAPYTLLTACTGYVTFNPAFQEEELRKLKEKESVAHSDHFQWFILTVSGRRLDSVNLGPNMVEVPVKELEISQIPDKKMASDKPTVI